jgi:hypothetical protein
MYIDIYTLQMSNDLLNSGAIYANWANLYAKEISTQNVNTDTITADDNMVCNGQLTANTIVSNGNIVALNRLEGNNLVITDDHDITGINWVNDNVALITLLESDSVKGTISINMNSQIVNPNNFYTVRIFHPAITEKSRMLAIFSHDPTIMSNANYLLYSNSFSVSTDCEDGFAQILIRNCAVGVVTLGTSFLNYQFLVC